MKNSKSWCNAKRTIAMTMAVNLDQGLFTSLNRILFDREGKDANVDIETLLDHFRMEVSIHFDMDASEWLCMNLKSNSSNQMTYHLLSAFKANPELKQLQAVKLSLDMHRFIAFEDPNEFIHVSRYLLRF
jgi:hypothetical protein